VVTNALVIAADGVGKAFGRTWAVRDLTFAVPRGQIFCLLGPSGSGKTTTMRMMLGVYVPDQGTLTVLGHPPADFRGTLHQRIGYMPQLFVLYPTLTVEENLNFVGLVYGLGLRHRRRRIREVLELVELWPDRRKTAGQISGGMQRRVALAAALLHTPELLFVDEPTAGIDPILRVKFWEEFRRLNEAGTTLVVTTQYVTEAEYCDQVAILSNGMLAALGSPLELRQRALGGEVIEVRASGFTRSAITAIQAQAGVLAVESPSFDLLKVTVADAAAAVPILLALLQQHGVAVESVDDVDPSFDEVFVRLVQQHRAAQDDPARVAPPVSIGGRVP